MNSSGEYLLRFVPVDFVHDLSVAIVSKEWIQNFNEKNYSYWPPYWKDNRKLSQAVIKGEPPNTNNWTLYPLNTIKAYGKRIFLVYLHISIKNIFQPYS